MDSGMGDQERVLAKCPGGQFDPADTFRSHRRIVNGGYDHQSSHRADDYRVDKRFQQTNEPFCSGLVGLYRRVSDRGGAEASFVGKHRPTKANDHDPDEAATDALRSKGTLPDLHNGRGQLSKVDRQNHQGQHDIQARHERDELGGGFGDALDPADDHQSHSNGHNKTQHPGLVLEEAGAASSHVNHNGDSLIGLEHVTDTKAAHHHRGGVKYPQRMA